jgi:alpha-amylase
LATLDRRPEAYHATVAAAAQGEAADSHGPAVVDRVILKQQGLDRLLVYDRHPRKALVDHFYPLDVTFDDLTACREVERGDFVVGAYLSRVQRGPERVTLLMERQGSADGHPIRVHKNIEMSADSAGLDVHYVLEDLPAGGPLHFAVEINLAAMAGRAPDRYYLDGDDRSLGTLETKLDLPSSDSLRLVDAWLDLSVGLEWSKTAGLWCFPIETVSQSEGGFEGVYQSSAVVPHWVITGDEAGRWEVRIRWTLGRASTTNREAEARMAGVGRGE